MRLSHIGLEDSTPVTPEQAQRFVEEKERKTTRTDAFVVTQNVLKTPSFTQLKNFAEHTTNIILT